MEVRPFRRADETLPQAHRSQTVPVPRLWTQLLSFWPPGFAQETPPASVKASTGQLEKDSVLGSTLDCTTLTWGWGVLKSWPYTSNSNREWEECSSGCKFRPFHLISLSMSWCQPAYHPPITPSVRTFWHHNRKIVVVPDQLWKVQTLLLQHLSWPESGALLWPQNQPSHGMLKLLYFYQLSFPCMHSSTDYGLKQTRVYLLGQHNVKNFQNVS